MQGKGLYSGLYRCENEREITNTCIFLATYHTGDNADNPASNILADHLSANKELSPVLPTKV
jgi:hypothetical protein